jgi:membrane protein DedA with SNARE-associated domain
MENIFTSLCEHAHSAHWIIFGLLMLAGLSLPISEDLLLLTGGAIASICIPEHKLHLFLWIFAGCWTSAWIAYWIGRRLGPKLYDIKWFNRFLTPKRITQLHHYYEVFGIYTFIFGRFIPGGVRNALFMSAGLGKMPFLKFIFRDGFACLMSSTIIFSLGFLFAENYNVIVHAFETYNLVVLGCIVLILAAIATYAWFKKTANIVV